MHYYYGSIFGLGGGIFMFFLFVVVIVLLVWAISNAGRRHYYHDSYQDQGNRGQRNTAGLDVLNERYAKGEITKEEYEQKKKDILS